MSRVVRYRVLLISETGCVRLWTKTGLLERVLTTSDLDGSVGKIKAPCLVKNSSVLKAAVALALDGYAHSYSTSIYNASAFTVQAKFANVAHTGACTCARGADTATDHYLFFYDHN